MLRLALCETKRHTVVATSRFGVESFCTKKAKKGLTDSTDPPTLLEHVDGDVVVVNALRVRVDAGEPTVPPALLVRLVNTSTFAAVTTIIVCGGIKRRDKEELWVTQKSSDGRNVVDPKAAQ